MSDFEKQYSGIIEEIAEAFTGYVDDGKEWDRATTLFLKLAKKTADEKQLIFRALRHGIQSLILNRMRQRRKVIICEQSGINQRQKERKDRSKEQQKQRRADISTYAKEHDLAEEDVASHKMNGAFKKFEETIEWEAKARARTILANWVCAGGMRLGKCTRDDLVKFAREHKASGEGTLRAGRFYESLIDHVPANGTVASVTSEVLVRCFDSVFSDAGIAAPTLPHTPIVTHPRPADDSPLSRQSESSPLSRPSTGTSANNSGEI